MSGRRHHAAEAAGRGIPDAEEIARLSGELLHDLNNALATLSAQIDVVTMEARLGSASPATLERLRDSFHQLQEMVSDLLEEILGRPASPDLEFDPCAVARVAFEQWLPSAPAVHAAFHSELLPTARVGGRSSLFSRALSNLLHNAARHATSEVRVRVATEGTLAEAMLLVTIDDDGPGVPETMREHLFEPLVHGGHGGAGLGLSLVRWAIGRLGGTAELSGVSPLGGARFVIRLPLVRRRTTPRDRGDLLPASSLAGRILAIVDSDGSLARAYTPSLRREGAIALHFTISHTADAEALAGIVGSIHADAVLLDHRIGGVDGLDVWRAMGRAAPELANRVLCFTPPGTEIAAPATRRPMLVDCDCPWPEARESLLWLFAR